MMPAPGTPGIFDPRVGLCAECRHARRHRSSRGSEFWLCGLAGVVVGFAKYPRLPVAACDGYERGTPEPVTGGDARQP